MAAVARPIPAMRVETPRGTTFRLTYGADTAGAPAVGFDRSRLDPALLDLASRGRRRGPPRLARHRRSTSDARRARGRATRTARRPRPGVGRRRGGRTPIRRGAGGRRRIAPSGSAPRVGLTYHLPTPTRRRPRDARMRILATATSGSRPVAGGRVNVGIVLGRSWRRRSRATGARGVAAAIVAAIPPSADDPADWRHGEPLDHVAGAWPLGHRVTRRAGPGWLLVGDAAGFLDPFTGEGLHRALVSAELAAAAIGARGAAAAVPGRLRRLRAGDAAPVPGQGRGLVAGPGVPRPPGRVRVRGPPGRRASRRVRATMGLVMGDLVPAGRALDPRYLARLLAP